VLNGDTFVELDFDAMRKAHHESGADMSLALKFMENPTRYGTVQLKEDGVIMAFQEKDPNILEGLINAGSLFAGFGTNIDTHTKRHLLI
jgi:NDP-sugar pyrophosphorylase family protein